MPYEIFLALRYLGTRRRRWMARVTGAAAVIAIGFGVAALIVAMALANGFRDEMRDKILRGTAHITLMRTDGQTIPDFRAVISRIRGLDGVTDASATTYDGALLSGPAGSAYTVLRGMDRESNEAVGEVRNILIKGSVEPLLNEAQPTEPAATAIHQSSPGPGERGTRPAITSFDEVPNEAALPSLVVGAELAARTGLRVGDTGQLVSAEATLTPLGLAPRYRRVRVAGIFRSGLYEYDSTWAYASLGTVESFAEGPPAASAINLKVKDIYDVASIAEKVRAAAGEGYTTVDWQQANRPLFAALALERRMGLVVIGLIILVAALNITATLVLIVVERRSDIAILGAMGARAASITLLFVFEGACIGAMGALLGVGVGVGACLLGDHYHLVSLPPDVYSLSNVPLHVRAGEVAGAALAAFVLSLLATIYPARAAARIRPVEALREA